MRVYILFEHDTTPFKERSAIIAVYEVMSLAFHNKALRESNATEFVTYGIEQWEVM